jgi:hypothetical protein
VFCIPESVNQRLFVNRLRQSELERLVEGLDNLAAAVQLEKNCLERTGPGTIVLFQVDIAQAKMEINVLENAPPRRRLAEHERACRFRWMRAD